MKTLIVLTLLSLSALAEDSPYSTDWNVNHIYPNQQSWDSDVKKIDSLLALLDKINKTEVTTADQLARVMQLVSDARSTAGKLAKVGLLQSSVDTSSIEYNKRYTQGQNLEQQVESKVAFLQPLLLSLDELILKEWLKLPSMKPHRNRVLRTLFLKPYSNDLTANKLLPEVGRLGLVMADLYGKTAGNDSLWPTMSVDDHMERINPANFRRLTRSSNRVDRNELNRVYYERVAELVDIFGLALVNRIHSQNSLAKAHNLNSATEWLLTLNDGFSPGSHNSFFNKVIELKPEINNTIVKLGKLRGKQVTTYNELFNIRTSQSTEVKLSQAFNQIRSLSEVFGQDYTALLSERLKEPWIHLAMSENKNATVGVFWQIGGTLAHSLLSYESNYRSARNLSSSVLLMMGYRSATGHHVPDKREEDFPVFSNAIWYLGKQLFDEHWLMHNDKDTERSVALETQFVTFLRTVYKGAMIAEFEVELNKRLNNNEVLTGEDISAVYETMLDKYFGDIGIDVPKHLKYEWVNHGTMFYGPHYISWAMSKYLALGMHEMILKEDQNAIIAVTKGIGNSQMHFSNEVLENSGIDMFSNEFLESVKQRINR